MVYSYDVFDTIITRKTASPKGVFLAVQNILLSNNTLHIPNELVAKFAYWRFLFEIRLKEKLSSEVFIEDVYSSLGEAWSLSKKQELELIQLEIQTDKSLIVPIQQIIVEIEQHLSKKERVVIISDMYYHESTIREILSSISPIFSHIKIYVSSEYKKTKSTGTLFREVLTLEHLHPQYLCHRGNDRNADFTIPTHIGINCLPFYSANLNSFENRLMSRPWSEKNYLINYVVGASRLCRLNNENDVINLMVFDVVAPQLLLFALDSIRIAKLYSCKKIYCLARDAYSLHYIIQTYLHYPVSLSYINRITVLRCYLTTFSLEKLRYIIVKKNILDFVSLFSIMGLPEVERNQIWQEFTAKTGIINHANYEEFTLIDYPNKDYYIDCFFQLLLPFSRKIEEYAKKQKELLEKYLIQEGIVGEENILFLDVGWNGTIQSELDLFFNHNNTWVSNFFFITDVSDSTEKNIKMGAEHTCFLDMLVESIFPSPLAPMVGYMRNQDDAMICPLFNCSSQKYDYQAYKKAIDVFFQYVDFKEIDRKHVPIDVRYLLFDVFLADANTTVLQYVNLFIASQFSGSCL